MVGAAKTARAVQTGSVARTATVVAMAGMAALGLLAAACTSSGGESGTDTTPDTTAPPSSTTSSTTTSTTAPQTEEAAILAAVDGYLSSLIASNMPPDPGHAGLFEFAADAALHRAITNIEQRQALSQAVRVPDDSVYSSESRLVTATGDEATVSSCVVDDTVLYDVPSGTVLNGRVSTSHFELSLMRIGGTWKVVRNVTLDSVEGVQPCGER